MFHLFLKKSRKDDVSNYRPVSLTCIVCKILEKIIKGSIWEHLNKYRLIRDSQHGFRSGRSCLTNLLAFLEYITKQLDEGNSVDVIYLDFSKAFDKVLFGYISQTDMLPCTRKVCNCWCVYVWQPETCGVMVCVHS